MKKVDAEITYDTDEGKGYTFIQHTPISPKLQDIIWSSALPNGTNWNNKRYEGKIIVKTLQIEQVFAVSQIKVTSRKDEVGRSGILNAQISLFTYAEYNIWLREQYESINQLSINYNITLFWEAFLERIWELKTLKSKIVIYRPFEGQRDIDINFALLINLCYKPKFDKRFINLFNKKTFTSLALSPDDKSSLVCIPNDESGKHKSDYINLAINF